jgi:glycerol-3-phosphate dehydrogenase (NAD(P)+)
MSESITVLGAGAFGTSMAKLLAEGGHRVTLWARDPAVVAKINEEHVHPRRLPKIRLPSGLMAVSHPEEALADASMVFSAIPTVAVRGVWKEFGKRINEGTTVVSLTKGIEKNSLMPVNEILRDILGPAHHENLSYLSGPSFALELAKRLPTAVTVAASNEETAQKVQRAVSTDYFRVYTTTDVIGVELGGALKNVIAIAAGTADGLGFGLNTRAALITRGLAEIGRLAIKMGANPMTLAGLAGMGDLVLTCTGNLSRNRNVGFKLGQGQKLADILEELGEVAEGVNTTESIVALAEKEGVEMPIAQGMYRLLFEDLPASDAVFELMGRKLKRETE